MEFPVYLIIITTCAALVLWSVHMSARKPGSPVTGLFAYRDADEEAPGEAAPTPPAPTGRWTGDRR